MKIPTLIKDFFHFIYIFLYCNTETGFKSSANESMTKENAIHKQNFFQKKINRSAIFTEVENRSLFVSCSTQSDLTKKKMFTRLTTTNSACMFLK